MHVKPNNTDDYNCYNKIPIIVFISLNHTLIIRTTQQVTYELWGPNNTTFKYYSYIYYYMFWPYCTAPDDGSTISSKAVVVNIRTDST